MASATPLKDIDEQFLQCCICMEQLKEPKILPCLHKYCQECLKKIAKKGAKKIECVTCREQHTLPEDGIDGLKTDFNTKNIIEFIQLQDSIRVDPLRTCIHCKKRLNASAFCFRCNDFLCETCHEFHASSSMFKNHHPHIFSLSEAEAANLTIQKLSSLKEAPRCQAHPGKLSELCCTTCHNLPICMPCTYGEHKGHDLTEVTSLAKIQREILRGKVVDLMQNKKKAYQMQEDIRKTTEKLNHNLQGEELKRQEQLNAEEARIKKKIRNAEEELSRKQAELEGEVKAKTSMRKKNLEERIKKLRQEYELVCEEERCEADASLKKLRKENKRETKRLQEGLRVVNDEFKELLTSLKTQKDEQAKKIKGLSDHFDGIVKRFETVSTTINCIRAAENVWADVQCIPDVCRAITLLSKDVKKGSTGLENLSALKSKELVETEEGGMEHRFQTADPLVSRHEGEEGDEEGDDGDEGEDSDYEDEEDVEEYEYEEGGEYDDGEYEGRFNEKLSLADQFQPPPGTWVCDTCMVQNPAEKNTCLACASPKPSDGSQDVGPSVSDDKPSLADMFRPPAGSWACDTCMVNNPGDKTACMACTTPKPGAQLSQPTANSFNFGAPKGPSLFGSPSSIPISFKVPSGFPSTSSAFSAGSPGTGPKPGLFSLGETSKQQAPTNTGL